MTGWIAVIGTVVTTLGVITVAWLTRRTAKDQTAVGGFSSLVTALQEQNNRQQEQNERQERRITALEKQAATQRQLEAKRHRVLRAHERWDQFLVGRMRQLTDDPFPDPPPLDVEV